MERFLHFLVFRQIEPGGSLNNAFRLGVNHEGKIRNATVCFTANRYYAMNINEQRKHKRHDVLPENFVTF